MRKPNYYFMANLPDGQRIVTDDLGHFIRFFKDDFPTYEGSYDEMLSALDRVVCGLYFNGYDAVVEVIDADNGDTILRVRFDPDSVGRGGVSFLEC